MNPALAIVTFHRKIDLPQGVGIKVENANARPQKVQCTATRRDANELCIKNTCDHNSCSWVLLP
jgi:hypothetical protein